MKFFDKVKTKVYSAAQTVKKERAYKKAAHKQIKKKATAAYYKASEKEAVKNAKLRAKKKVKSSGSALSGFLNHAGSISRSEMSSGFGGFNQPKKKKKPTKEWWDY